MKDSCHRPLWNKLNCAQLSVHKCFICCLQLDLDLHIFIVNWQKFQLFFSFLCAVLATGKGGLFPGNHVHGRAQHSVCLLRKNTNPGEFLCSCWRTIWSYLSHAHGFTPKFCTLHFSFPLFIHWKIFRVFSIHSQHAACSCLPTSAGWVLLTRFCQKQQSLIGKTVSFDKLCRSCLPPLAHLLCLF